MVNLTQQPGSVVTSHAAVCAVGLSLDQQEDEKYHKVPKHHFKPQRSSSYSRENCVRHGQLSSRYHGVITVIVIIINIIIIGGGDMFLYV